MHKGEVVNAATAHQLRLANKRACVRCGTFRAKTERQCNACGKNTSTKDICAGDVVPSLCKWYNGTRADPCSGSDQHDAADAQTLRGTPSSQGAERSEQEASQRPGEGETGDCAQGEEAWEQLQNDEENDEDAQRIRELDAEEDESRARAQRSKDDRQRARTRPTRRLKDATVPEGLLGEAEEFMGGMLSDIPQSISNRYTDAMSDGLEGSLGGDKAWGRLAELRPHL